MNINYRINIYNFLFGLIFVILPFFDFININYLILDKSIIFTLSYIFLFVLALLYLIQLIINNSKFKKINFIFLFLSICFFFSFSFYEIKKFISLFTTHNFYVSSFLIILLYGLLFKFLSLNIIKKFFYFYGVFLLIYNCFLLYTNFNNLQKNIYASNVEQKIFNNQKIHKNDQIENIYFFILDGMTSVNYFRTSFEESDNVYLNIHIDLMDDNNFIFHQNTLSNYNSTYLSLASIMQLDYPVIDTSPKYFDRGTFWPYLMSNPKKKPRLMRILEENKISFKWYGNITASCKNYSYNKDFCPKKSVSNFFYVFNSFFKKTPLIIFLRKSFPEFMLSGYGDNIDSIKTFLSDFNELDLNTKTFYLIHHLAPHPPYIHNSDCSIKDENKSFITDKDFSGYKDAYACAIKMINKSVKIINESDKNALIVFTADHGWILKEKKGIDENLLKFHIYNSFKIKNSCKRFVDEKMDLISTARLILGCNINKEPIFTNKSSYIGFQEKNEKFGEIIKAF